MGSILGRDTPMSLKLVVVASPFALRIVGIVIRLTRHCQDNGLVNPIQNKPWFACVCSTSLSKKLWEKEKLQRAISPFPRVFTNHLENFLPFLSNLKFSSANSFSLEQSKICCLGKN